MIMKTWALCALAATAVQIVLAMKCRWYWGLILPACFGAFTIYAWEDLMSIGIQFSVLAALAIPPIWLVSIFDVFYWRRKWKGIQGTCAGDRTAANSRGPLPARDNKGPEGDKKI